MLTYGTVSHFFVSILTRKDKILKQRAKKSKNLTLNVMTKPGSGYA
jgi:hypothetical protein